MKERLKLGTGRIEEHSVERELATKKSDIPS
jgi:hypothetical protein